MSEVTRTKRTVSREEVAEIVSLRESNARLLEAAKRAENLISHFRNMVIEGQITITPYASEHLPSDYDTLAVIREAIRLHPATINAEGEK